MCSARVKTFIAKATIAEKSAVRVASHECSTSPVLCRMRREICRKVSENNIGNVNLCLLTNKMSNCTTTFFFFFFYGRGVNAAVCFIYFLDSSECPGTPPGRNRGQSCHRVRRLRPGRVASASGTETRTHPLFPGACDRIRACRPR